MTQRERRTALALKAPSLARYALAAILVPIMLIAVLYWLRQEVGRSEALRVQAADTFTRRLQAVELLSGLKDAETAQRGFLITGDPAFLQPFIPGRIAISQRIAWLKRSAGPREPAAEMDTVEALTRAKLIELERTIAAAQAGDLAGARAMVASGRGKKLMDELRRVLGRQIRRDAAASAADLAAFTRQREQVQAVVWTVVILLSLGLVVFLVALWRVRQARYVSLVEAFEAGERNETILNSTIDAIVILNPSGTVEVMNEAATRMLGYSARELERRDVATILDLAPGNGSFHKRIGLHDGQLDRTFLTDQVVRHRDGREIAVDVAMGVMSLPSGDHIVVSLRDISERKRIERVKDDLISTVSHELRTPLTSIVGSLGLLRSGAAGTVSADAQRLVEIAENNSRRLIRLINDMLDIDRIESGTLQLVRESIDLRQVVDRGCLGGEGLAQSRGVAIACRLPDQPVMVCGDADRLLQVVTNLVANAVRAAPEGTTVELSMAIDAGRQAVVTIADRGGGIPQAFRDRIFGRFERADQEASTGTGLGLAISREIVARHDGRIWFEDRPGGGTMFRFALAVLGTAAARDTAAQCILICEQDEAVAAGLCALVVGEGCTYDVVTNAEAAHAAMQRRRYAALIVDLNLPPTGGLAFARGVREVEPPVIAPILVIAHGVAGADAAGSPLDVIDWIDKPGEPDRLVRALRSALTRTRADRPVVLHLDDDPDLLEVVATALEPEIEIATVTDLCAARAFLTEHRPDAVILDLRLAEGQGTDLIPFLVDRDGLAIPTVIYSAQDVSAELAARVDAVLVKARGSIPDLKATLRRLLRPRADHGQEAQ